MPISSMTGFSRGSAARDGFHWQWEVKSVNGKALDVRCRMPAGFEALEQDLRAAVAESFKRGNFQISLTVSGAVQEETVRLNDRVLDQLVAAGERLRNKIGGEALRADVLLSLRGVLEVSTPEEDEVAIAQRNAAMLDSFAATLKALVNARREEGERLQAIIMGQIDRIAELAAAARGNPARSIEAVRARLAEQVTRLMETGSGFDPDRLHQEAVMLATRSDIQEELDRLDSHVAAARALLASSDSVGRKFDFLAQEFNREANTLCSKAADNTMTTIGLDLKTVIDQLREQIQNIE
jgi:uncharacterized protein (TIGR00255 family)